MISIRFAVVAVVMIRNVVCFVTHGLVFSGSLAKFRWNIPYLRILEIERRSIRSHCVENSLKKRLCTCRVRQHE